MTNDELAKHYVELSLKYESEQFTKCGFKEATKARMQTHEKILKGSLSKKDLREIAPIFHYGNIDIYKYIKPRKKFFIF